MVISVAKSAHQTDLLRFQRIFCQSLDLQDEAMLSCDTQRFTVIYSIEKSVFQWENRNCYVFSWKKMCVMLRFIALQDAVLLKKWKNWGAKFVSAEMKKNWRSISNEGIFCNQTTQTEDHQRLLRHKNSSGYFFQRFLFLQLGAFSSTQMQQWR